MKIDFGMDRIIKKLRGFFHVIFALMSVFLLGIHFVVADENELGCNKGYVSDGEKCVYAFEFEDIVYTGIIDGDEVQVVFMDRNLGATTNDISDTGSYGYFFQWGNNYPFSNLGDVLVTSQVDSVSVYSWQNPYYSSDFIKVGNKSWFKGSNKDLWGGSGDVLSNSYDNGEDKIRRQGPCPDGYYIPSLNDVYQLFELYFNNHGIVGYDKFPSKVGSQGPADFTGLDTTLMLAEFKIPVAGFLGGSHDYKRYEGHTGDSNKNTASLWSSTPGKKDGEGYTWEIHTTPVNKISIGGWSNYSSLGIPVRCFKYLIDCEENTHQEGGECVSNTKTGYCIQTSGLHNGIYTGVDEILNLEYTGGAWNIPVCDIICDDGYELSGGNCELEILDCGFEEHQEGTGCVSNYRMDYCLELNTIINGSYTGIQEQIQVERSGGDWIIPECEIVCDDGYELSGGLCYGYTVDIIFETYSGTAIASITGLERGTDISNLRPISDPKLKNNMFAGWFDASGNRFEFEGTQLWNTITLYARFLEFEDIVYTGIIDGDEVQITLMDRNLGATATGVGLSALTGSFGYYYQWGNNHGFYGRGDLTGDTKVDISTNGPLNWFYGKTFILTEGGRARTFNNNIWGGSGDVLSNSYDNGNLRFNRQGPCPKGYHIPSLYEWHTLLALYLENNGYSDATGFPSSVGAETSADFFLGKTGIDNFLSTFYLPVAGRVLGGYSYQRYATYKVDKNVVHLWSSTPYDNNRDVFGMEVQLGNKGKAIADPKINVGGWPTLSATAYPVRCFRNNDDYTITWMNDDGTVLEIDDDVYEGEIPEYYGETPTKADDAYYRYEFSGWNLEVVAATQDAVYTAVYLSMPKSTYTVTWQNYDGIILEFDTGLSIGDIPEYNGSTPTKPSDSGYNYVFVGWNPEITGIVDDMYYTAMFSGEEIGCELGYHKENGECTGNTKYVACRLEGAPTHATYSGDDVLIYWDGTGRSVAERCTWVCDENYHQEGNNCALDTYILSFSSSGGAAISSKIVEYGEIITLPGTTRLGYQFSGWYDQGGEFVGLSGDTYLCDMTGNTVLYARWLANTGTHYTVRHRLENADDDLYTESISDRQILQGTTDSLTNATANYYTGFLADDISQLLISGDETTVVDIYYNREVYTITIDLDGGTGMAEITGKYGQSVTSPDISKSGYTFKKYIPSFPSIMPLYGTSVTVVWVPINGGVSISIVPISGSDFNFGSVVSSTRVQILTGYLGENSFQLEDSRGENSGYYVTLDITPLTSVNTSNIISSSNIQLKSHGITTISGTPAEDVGIEPQITTWTTMTGTVVYLIRPDISDDDELLIGKYGDNLEFKVTVPPYTYSDRYKAVITYTLYDND